MIPRTFIQISRQTYKLRFHFNVINKESIINLSLIHAAARGFNDRCIIDACTDLQLTSAAHTIIKPIEVIHYAMKKWNLETLEEIKNDQKFIQSNISTKIKTLIQERLQKQSQYMNKWNEAMANGAYPDNTRETLQILWQYADDCWYLAGDRSNDYNFYTKRLMFLYAYVTTEMHMLTDKSNNFEQTWCFLDRRIEEILLMGSNILFLRQILTTLQNSGYNMLFMFESYPTRFNQDNIKKE